MSLLTDARNAIWDAVENWGGLQSGGSSIFKRKYKFDGDDSPEMTPHANQLPALLVDRTPGGNISQAKNRIWQYDAGYKFLMWTEGWNLGSAELYELELIKALFQSASSANPGIPYIVDATGFLPRNDFNVKHTRILIDNSKVTETEILFRLRVRFNAMG